MYARAITAGEFISCARNQGFALTEFITPTEPIYKPVQNHSLTRIAAEQLLQTHFESRPEQIDNIMVIPEYEVAP